MDALTPSLQKAQNSKSVMLRMNKLAHIRATIHRTIVKGVTVGHDSQFFARNATTDSQWRPSGDNRIITSNEVHSTQKNRKNTKLFLFARLAIAKSAATPSLYYHHYH